MFFVVVNDFCGIMNCDTFSVVPSIISDNVTDVLLNCTEPSPSARILWTWNELTNSKAYYA